MQFSSYPSSYLSTMFHNLSCSVADPFSLLFFLSGCSDRRSIRGFIPATCWREGSAHRECRATGSKPSFSLAQHLKLTSFGRQTKYHVLSNLCLPRLYKPSLLVCHFVLVYIPFALRDLEYISKLDMILGRYTYDTWRIRLAPQLSSRYMRHVTLFPH